jgi:hypothetical protein
MCHHQELSDYALDIIQYSQLLDPALGALTHTFLSIICFSESGK